MRVFRSQLTRSLELGGGLYRYADSGDEMDTDQSEKGSD